LDAAEAVLALRQAMAQAADFTLTGLDGRSDSLSAMRGQVVLVNFWSTTCPPCRKEMPDLEKLHRTLANRGFTVLAISHEEGAEVADFIQKGRYTFPVLLDPGKQAFRAFGVEGIPQSFLFDRSGRLTAQAVEMRSERQFLEMLQTAGLTVESK
jgi:peroxiredoxin